MLVREITTLLENEYRVVPQGTGNNRVYNIVSPDGNVVGSEKLPGSARRIATDLNANLTTPSARTTSSEPSSNTSGSRGSRTDIKGVVLRSEPGLRPVHYSLVQYNNDYIPKTGSVSQFFEDLEKHDPALRASLKAEADRAKANAEKDYKSRKGSFVKRMRNVNFAAWLFASLTQVYEAWQLMQLAQRSTGTHKQDAYVAFMNYMVPALGDVGAITATFWVQHYVGGRFIGGALMAGKVKSGNFWRAAADALDGRSKSTRWWQQFHPRKIVGDVLAYIFGSAAANAVSQHYLRQIGLLEEWAMWEFLNRDFVPIIADFTGISEDDVSNALNVPDKPDIDVSESDIEAAIEAVENNEVQEILDQTEEAIEQYGDMPEKGSDFWNN
jgi:hypothetical protein